MGKKDKRSKRARKIDRANLAMDENNGIYHFEDELAEWIEKH